MRKGTKFFGAMILSTVLVVALVLAASPGGGVAAASSAATPVVASRAAAPSEATVAMAACTGPVDPTHPKYVEQLQLWNNLLNGLYTLPVWDTGDLKVVDIKFHIINRPGGVPCTPAPTQADIDAMVVKLNDAFSQASIQFQQKGGLDVFESTPYHRLLCVADYDALLATQAGPGANDPNAVDVYFVDQVDLSGVCGATLPPLNVSLSGIATWSASALQGIVLRKCGSETWNPCQWTGPFSPPACGDCNDCAVYVDKILVHEMGHYFDILHPSEIAFGVECTGIENTNCGTCGDFLCDTPAEPTVLQIGTNNCEAINLPPPLCGAGAYEPAT